METQDVWLLFSFIYTFPMSRNHFQSVTVYRYIERSIHVYMVWYKYMYPSMCYEVNVCLPTPNLHGKLLPSVMVLEGVVFGVRLELDKVVKTELL